MRSLLQGSGGVCLTEVFRGCVPYCRSAGCVCLTAGQSGGVCLTAGQSGGVCLTAGHSGVCALLQVSQGVCALQVSKGKLMSSLTTFKGSLDIIVTIVVVMLLLLLLYYAGHYSFTGG